MLTSIIFEVKESGDMAKVSGDMAKEIGDTVENLYDMVESVVVVNSFFEESDSYCGFDSWQQPHLLLHVYVMSHSHVI